MPVSPARQLACDILLLVDERGGYATDLLHSARTRGLAPADRRLATELVLGVLRWRAALDFVIERAARRPIAKIPALPLTALRLGAYQLRMLDRVPPSAAVHESVELAKPAGAKTAGFVNAVLRHLPRTPLAALLATEPDANLARRREAEFSHPAWLLERWSRNFSPAAAASIAEYDNQPPPTACWPPQAIPGVEMTPGLLLRTAARVTAGEITQSAPFRQGRLWVQDEASQLMAHLLAATWRRHEQVRASVAGERSPATARPTGGRPAQKVAVPLAPQGRERVLDACAAPGSKTALLAALAPQATIFALERHVRRAQVLARRARRAGGHVHVIAADATAPLPLTARFDRILVDAPCTGTGTLARNPEIRWRLRPEDPARLARLQLAILRRAVAALAPGGRLVYSVCSIEPEEGPEVMAALLGEFSHLRVEPAAEVLSGLRALKLAPAALCAGPWLRLLPGAFSTDGFFAAVLRG